MVDTVNTAKVNRNNNNEIEIDLRELFMAVWRGKWYVLVVTILFFMVTYFYVSQQANIYRSEALLAPVDQDQSLSLGGLKSQIGGLASLAGVNIGSSSHNNTQLAIQILKSRHFASNFIEQHEITPDLMAAKEWVIGTNTIVYDNSVYDESSKTWVRKVSYPRVSKPTLQEAYEVFKQTVDIVSDKQTGMITVSVEHISPIVAQQWLSWIIDDINNTMKTRDVIEAEESNNFLRKQLQETKISDIREVLYNLIEEQTKTIMFANVREEYVFKVIDPPLVPEMKSGPNRLLKCILGGMLGGMLATLFVTIRYFKLINQ